jgi:uncharacterized lipoprotein
MHKLKLPLMLLILTLSASGCALTKESVDIRYTPQTDVKMINGASNVEVNAIVDDNRMVKDKVSSKKNGFGMEMAPILCNQEISDTLKDAIDDELKNRGFQIGAGNVVVDVELNTFYNDFKIGFWSGSAVADMQMNVKVKDRAGNILYTETIQEQNVAKGVQLMSGNNAKLSLEAVLDKAIRKLFDSTAFVDSLFKAGKS